jgi:hypothetical protein
MQNKLDVDQFNQFIDRHLKEEQFFDYKEEWHQNKAELLRDILCLSNVSYQGDRYLIFGVSDKGEKIGVKNTDSNRLKDHNLYNWLGDLRLNKPLTIQLYVIEDKENSREFDIIQISDSNHKPFFLLKDVEYPKQKTTQDSKQDSKTVTVRSGVIYTRNGNTNTPINGSAHENDIEKMWRNRFGIDLSVLERFKLLLQEKGGWDISWDADGSYHHKVFPEFQIREDFEDNQSVRHKEEWARGCIGYHYDESSNGTSEKKLYYHQTCIKRILLCDFDGSKKTIVAPKWEPMGRGNFYFYYANDIVYSYKIFLNNKNSKDDSKGIRRPHTSLNREYFDIPIFKNENDLLQFKQYAALKNASYSYRSTDPEFDHTKQNILFCELMNLYFLFKEETVNSVS